MMSSLGSGLPAKLADYLSKDTTFRAIYDYTKQRFNAAPQLYAHNFEHARRDTLNVIAISEPEGADMHIVLCAAIMHDIGYLYGAHRQVHGEVGAQKLSSYLAEANIKLAATEQGHIAECIRTHKGVTHGVEPATLEAKVVADADHLDKYGPVGVYQTILALSEFGLTIEEVIERFKKGRDLPMFTATGTRLAQSLREFNQQFEQSFVTAYSPYITEESEETA